MFERGLNMLIDKAHSIAMKWHLLIGFSFGSVFAFLQDHLENIVEGALVGLAGAVSASAWKIFVEWVVKKRKERRKKTK